MVIDAVIAEIKITPLMRLNAYGKTATTCGFG
jgi:hypothetical protein